MADTTNATDATDATDATLSCANCGQRESDASGKLKRCAKCHTTTYCSRPCQKADWKTHKKTCAAQAAAAAATASHAPGTTTPSAFTFPAAGAIDNPFHQLEARTWLHDRSEQTVYKLLTDAYRFRMEDDYRMTGDVANASLYGGAADSGRRHFRRFLSLAERQPGLLPPWWSTTHAAACEREAMDEHRWSCLTSAVEKDDLIEHYGSRLMPMQLRMFAEQVYGMGPGGQSGDAMRQMMMKIEADRGEKMHSSVLDMSSSFRGMKVQLAKTAISRIIRSKLRSFSWSSSRCPTGFRTVDERPGIVPDAFYMFHTLPGETKTGTGMPTEHR
ncbi:MAG: hypothetical protein M1826_002943 [Phylliscum demangeonii]|nr:MAG: hypothetical protein M1826_002943 [Phylliscum demangeonii]